MKRTLVALLAVFAFVGAGAFVSVNNAAAEECETRDVPAFSKVKLEGTGTAVITQGDEQSVTICGADSDWVDDVNTEVTGGELDIEQGSGSVGEVLGIFADAELRYEITMPTLTELEVHGIVQVEVKDFSLDDLELIGRDSSETQISGVDATFLNVDLNDAAKVNGDGVVQTLTLDLDDASEAHFLLLDATDVEVNMAEVSSARVRFSGTLTADVSDISELEYMTNGGSTDIDTSDLGSAKGLDFEELASGTPTS
jgi:hypothetical protein